MGRIGATVGPLDPADSGGLGGLLESEMRISVGSVTPADSDEVDTEDTSPTSTVGSGEASASPEDVEASVDPEDDSEVEETPDSTPVTEAWESSVAVGKDPVAFDPTKEASVVDGSAVVGLCDPRRSNSVDPPVWTVDGASVSDPIGKSSVVDVVVVVVEGSLVEVASSILTSESVAAEGDSEETAEGAGVVSPDSGAPDSGVVSV